jgi:adenylate cyclase
MKFNLIFLFLLPASCYAWGDFDWDTIKIKPENVMQSPAVSELRFDLIDLYLSEKGKKMPELMEACLTIGDLYNRELFFEKAIEYYSRAEKIAEQMPAHPKLTTIQTRIAEALLDDGKPDLAHDAFLILLKKHEQAGDYKLQVLTLQRLADACLAMKSFSKASAYYLKIKDLAESKKDPATLATAFNNLGFTANRLKDFKTAVEYFSLAEKIASENSATMPGYVYTNLGIAWNNLGDYNRSVDNLRKAEDSKSEDRQKGYIQHLISSVHLKNEDIYSALRYNELTLKTAKKNGNKEVLCDALDMASQIYQQLFEYDKALDFYKKHLALKDSLVREERLQQQYLEALHSLLERTENETLQNLADEEVRQLTMEQLNLNNQRLQLEADNQRLEADRREKELALLEQEQKVKDAQLLAARLEARRIEQDRNLIRQQFLAEKQTNEIASLNQQRKLDSLESARDQAVKQNQIDQLESDKRMNELHRQKEEAFRKNAYQLGGLLGLLLLTFLGSWLYSRRLNKRLAEQNHQIESQKQEIDSERSRAEGLLLNILPGEVAQELKSNGAATPRHYKSVSVLFTDFAGFTKIASGMPPGKVVQELNECFLAFDEISERHRLEKIKTIGDSYMCAGGLPAENDTHPADAVAAALEMLDFVKKRNRELASQGKPEWPIRIGIHTGEVVAGVVGSKKFAYDIWGDTVNVASRMENNAEHGTINISDETHRRIEGQIPCAYRGEVEVKNKGKMGMYVVETQHHPII